MVGVVLLESVLWPETDVQITFAMGYFSLLCPGGRTIDFDGRKGYCLVAKRISVRVPHCPSSIAPMSDEVYSVSLSIFYAAP